MKWLHKLLHPHCPDCRDEKDRERYNPIEDFLKGEISRLQIENRMLLERLLGTNIKEEEATEPKIFNPIPMSHTRSWSVKAQMLEQEDRAKNKLMNEEREKNKTKINELEKELGITGA